VLRSLAEGSRPVSELAEPHGMSLPGFLKHLKVLEDAGLITRFKEGRVVRCTLRAEPMQEALMWLAFYEKFWAERLDALERYLEQQEETNPWTSARSKSARRSRSSGAMRRPRRGSGGRGPSRRR
jgi:DNA-binding Lrp family transcriptional regulator